MPAECSADGGQESKGDSPAALLENADETLSRGAGLKRRQVTDFTRPYDFRYERETEVFARSRRV